jgi:hypothetical protein
MEISAVHLLNYFPDPAKDPGIRIAMKRIHCTFGKMRNQTYSIRRDMLNMLLANTGGSTRGLRDAALL